MKGKGIDFSLSDGTRGTFTFDGLKPIAQPVSGRWYLGFDCLECKQRFAFIEDPCQGREQVLAEGGEVVLQCPHCGNTRMYPAEVLDQYLA